MKKLYALVVGINDYPNCPLKQCVPDAEKMIGYLETLKPQFDAVEIQQLINKKANKKGIVSALQVILKKLKKEDTFIFYFSGHGAQEKAIGRFKAEQDDLLEGLVCCPKDEYFQEALLADKELRYLLRQCKANPHIVTVFDCCHSGDMVRSTKKMKRVAEPFPARPYKEFIFHQELSEAQLKKVTFSKHFPFKNTIHISACQSNQFAWEDSRGGVFTNYLLTLLKQTKNRLNYQFLAQWAKLNLRNQTHEKQVPTISVQGTGSLTERSNWLGIYTEDRHKGGQLVHHEKEGWQLTMGKLMGIQKGMGVTIQIEGNKTISTKVKKAGLDYATVGLSTSEKNSLNQSKIYAVQTKATHQPLNLYLHDADKNPAIKERIRALITEQAGVKISPKNKADFQLNIFNHQIYFSMPDCPYQPLHRQLAVATSSKFSETTLVNDLAVVKHWHKVNSLVNPAQYCQSIPIKIELIPDGKEQGIDITDNIYTLQPNAERDDGELSKYFKIKVTNVSKNDLYLVALSLGSDLSISADSFGHQCVLLPAGKSKFFYDHDNDATVHCFFDKYKEFYNWPKEWFHYKLIVNSVEDISATIGTFTQAGLTQPLPFPSTMRGTRKKGTADDGFWGVYTSTIELTNSTYNQVTGALEEDLETHLADESVGPYLRKVYGEGVLAKAKKELV